MNKFGRLFLFALLASLLVACSPVAQGLQQLPDEGRSLVLFLVTAGVTWVLLKASIVFHADLSGYSGVVAVALAPIIVTVIESWLKLIPPIYDNIVLTIIHLIVLLAGSLGTFFLFQRKTPSIR